MSLIAQDRSQSKPFHGTAQEACATIRPRIHQGHELCGLRVGDVDLLKKLVRIRQAVWRGKVQTPKSKKSIRDIPIPVGVVDAMTNHIGGRSEGFVFTTKNGTPWK